MIELSSLDDLFREAKATLRVQRTAKAALPTEAADPLAIWRNPANWRRTRGVALVHAVTMTLLGNFVEYLHKTELSARRLVREDPGLPVTSTEYMHEAWAQPAPIIAPDAAKHRTVYCTVGLHLPQVGVHCPRAKLIIHLADQTILRVNLRERTLFQQGTTPAFIYLPSDTDLLRELAVESLEAVKKELQ